MQLSNSDQNQQISLDWWRSLSCVFTMDLAESDEFMAKLTLAPKEKDYRRRNGEDEAET